MTYFKQILPILFSILLITPAFSQNKDVEKGKEILAKAMAAKEAAKKNDLLKSAIEHFTKGGLKKEMNAIIGDAFLEAKDYTGASNYYGRCDKEGKKEGLKKVGEGYVEEAFSDEKTEAKMLAKKILIFMLAVYQKTSPFARRFFVNIHHFPMAPCSLLIYGRSSTPINRHATASLGFLEKLNSHSFL